MALEWEWIPPDWLEQQPATAPQLAIAPTGTPGTVATVAPLGAGAPPTAAPIAAPMPEEKEPELPLARWAGVEPLGLQPLDPYQEEPAAEPDTFGARMLDARPDADPYAFGTQPDPLGGPQGPVHFPVEENPANPLPSSQALYEGGTPKSQAALVENEFQWRRRMDPRQVAMDRVQAAQREQDFIRDEEDRAFQKRTEREHAAQAAYDKAMAEAKTERIALQEEAKKSGSESWWETRSTGQEIAAFIAAIGGGLLAPYHGGRNSGLEMILASIDRHTADRKQRLAERRGLLGEQIEQNADDLRAGRVAALADYERAKHDILKAAAELDPAGTQARNLFAAAAGVENAMQEKARAIEVEDRGHKLKLEEFDWKKKQDQEELRLKRAAAGAAAQARADARAEKEKDRALEKYKADLQYGHQREKEAREIQQHDEARTLNVPGTGQTVKVKDPTVRAKLEEATAGVTRLSRQIDNAKRLRAQMSGVRGDTGSVFGFAPEAFKTDKRKRIEAVGGQMLGSIKQIEELGAFDKGVERYGDLVMGDLGGFSDPIPRLEEMRKDAIANLQTKIRAAAVPGDDSIVPDIPDLSKAFSGVSDEVAIKNMTTYSGDWGTVDSDQHEKYTRDVAARAMGDREDPMYKALAEGAAEERNRASAVQAEIAQRRDAAQRAGASPDTAALEREYNDRIQRAQNYEKALQLTPEQALDIQ